MGVATTIVVGVAKTVFNLLKDYTGPTCAVEIENHSTRGLEHSNYDDPWGDLKNTADLPSVPPIWNYETYDDPKENPKPPLIQKSVVADSAVGIVNTKGIRGIGIQAALVWKFSGKANLWLLVAVNTAAVGDNEGYYELSNGFIHAHKWLKPPTWYKSGQLHVHCDQTKFGIKLSGSLDNETHARFWIRLEDAS